jgi:hypothetical protein
LQTLTKAQSGKDKEIIQDCDSAKAEFIKTDPLLANYLKALPAMLFFPMWAKVL